MVEQNKRSKVGIYARISRDEDKSYESITNQIDGLTRFAKENQLHIADIYADDNVSGYLFNQRPEFNRMKADLENDKINTILCKDLSRIGRNNARTLLFLEEMALNDKRVILVDDRYDSFNEEDQTRGDFLPINSFVNEIYVKDISRKVRFSIKEKQLQGTLLIRSTFGYRKDGERLIVDEVTSAIVKEIFQLYRDGYGYRKIANILNEKDYPTPSEVDNTKRQTTKIWNATHVNRILKNEIYTGVYQTRKTVRKSIKSKQFHKIPEDEWIRIENHHEAIIPKEEFALVQNIIEKRNKNHIRAGGSKINLFAGLIFCHECNSPMFCIKNERFATHYQCGNYYKYGTKVCSSHRIMEKVLIAEILYETMKIIKSIKKSLASTDESLRLKAETQKNFTGHIDRLKKTIHNKKKDKMLIYKDKIKGIIDEEMYLELTREIDINLRTLEKQLVEYQRLQKESESSDKTYKEWLDVLDGLTVADISRKEIMEQIVHKIEVNKDKEIEEIQWVPALEAIAQ